MPDQKSVYRGIFKTTTLFGGVQVFKIIITIVRSKIVAVLIGSTGIGVLGLFNSTLALITSITGFGIDRSATRNIAEANSGNEIELISKSILIVRRLIFITGLFGAVLSYIFSSSISVFTFGNSDYSGAFKWLAITLFLNQVSAGQSAVLRGMRLIKYMAKSSLLGAIAGLIISIPLYYYYKLDGIVPAILISSVSVFIITWYFNNKIQIQRIRVSKSIFYSEAPKILKLGFVLSLGSIIIQAESYFIRIIIQKLGSIEDVGFYGAGFALINTYFDVIFTALVTDYYPRLASVAKNNSAAIKMMNEQSEMTLLILSPLLIVFLVCIKLIILLLYTKEFLIISYMIHWGALGIYFKSASWALGVIFMSKGDVKTLFWTNLSSTLVMFVLNVLGYYYYKLDGLGISFLLSYLFAYIQTFIVVKYKYSFKYDSDFIKVFIVCILISLVYFILVHVCNQSITTIIGIILIFLNIAYSIFSLNKRMDIKSIIKDKLKNR
jgi:O-antigen/teichoic acid export membrane protein